MKGKGNEARRRSVADTLWYIPLVVFIVGIIVMNMN